MHREALRNKRRNRGRVAAALRAAAARGEIQELPLGSYFKLADACCDAAAEASDSELDTFMNDCCGTGVGAGFELFEKKVSAKLDGSFIDIITQLLPIVLPLLLACF